MTRWQQELISQSVNQSINQSINRFYLHVIKKLTYRPSQFSPTHATNKKGITKTP